MQKERRYTTAWISLDFKNFSLHFTALFTFPLQYLFTIGFKMYLIFEGGAPTFNFRLLMYYLW